MDCKVKEKRKKEPNWTKPEKQLLLLLTCTHRELLENKRCDTKTIKLKSQVWDEITTNMQAAGYKRSKKRLKQQLERLRAAEVRKLKEAQTKSAENNRILQTENESPNALQENNEMKLEKCLINKHVNMKCNHDEENYLSTSANAKALMGYKIKPCIEPKPSGNVLENIDIISKIPTSTNDPPSIKPPITAIKMNCRSTDNIQLDIDDDVANHLSTAKNNCQLRLYRIAAERERIRGLKLHRKHERLMEREQLRMLRIQERRNYVLYRKNVQIQDLKLQLLKELLKATKCQTNNGFR